MESETDFGIESETPIGAGDVDEGKGPETTAGGTDQEGEGGEAGEAGEGTKAGGTGEAADTEEVGGEHVEGEHVDVEHTEDEHLEGEKLEGEHVEGDVVEGEATEGEHVEGEQVEGEGLMGEELEGTEKVPEDELLPPLPVEVVEEEEYEPEPPPDPAAPYDFSDSKEALKAPFELQPDQLAEVEQLWEVFQNYTPAYTDLDGYVTQKELVYMLKSLLIMTYTEEQLQELVAYCCRPPHKDGHIFYEQFLKMVTIRIRDFPVEEQIRSALQFYDPEKQGCLDREFMREVLTKQGHKMIPKLVDNLIKEVDLSNDGTIGLEDVVGTMCIDLDEDDMQLLRASVYPPKEAEGPNTEVNEF